MGSNLIDRECVLNNEIINSGDFPMLLVQRLIAGKWKILILWHLRLETHRFSDIKSKLLNISTKMITSQLRSLENDNLIFRKVYPVVPPRVEYGLTELGKQIVPILEMLYSFGVVYKNEYNDANLNK